MQKSVRHEDVELIADTQGRGLLAELSSVDVTWLMC